jgi:hypothetical protein
MLRSAAACVGFFSPYAPVAVVALVWMIVLSCGAGCGREDRHHVGGARTRSRGRADGSSRLFFQNYGALRQGVM